MEKDKIIAYLNNDNAEFDKAKVEKWISDNKAEFNRIKYIWEKAGVVNNEVPNIEKAWLKINPEKTNKKENEKKKISLVHSRFQRIAAVLVIAFLLGFITYHQISRQNYRGSVLTETINNTDESIKVILADGSEVWLNTGSKLSYPKKFTNNNREVKLQGEAFFDVARDESKPFIILTGNTKTQVFGTSFNVKQESFGDIQVSVVSGRVALSDIENETSYVELTKNEVGVYTKQSKTVKKYANRNLNFLAWKTGILSFDKTSLEDVCKTLSDHYKTNLQISDEPLKQLNLTANYDNKSFEQVLEIIQLTLNIQVERTDTSILLFSIK